MLKIVNLGHFSKPKARGGTKFELKKKIKNPKNLKINIKKVKLNYFY